MPPEPPPADLPRRLAAAIYDLLILAGVLVLTSFIVILARGGVAVPAGDPLYRIFLAAQIAAYFIYFWRQGGQTPGMRTWRLRIETVQGRPVSLLDATKRFLAALVSIAPAGLGLLWMLADSNRRTWHDHLSGTRVVRLDDTGCPGR